MGKELTELQFTDELIKAVSPIVTDAKIDSGISVLYEMPIDDDGVVRMGVDANTGQAYRGKGTGFEQDILIYEEKSKGNTTIIPRVIAEVKCGRVTTKGMVALFVILALVSCGTAMGSRDSPIKNWFESGKIYFGATKAEVAPLIGGEPLFNCRKAKVTAEGEEELWDLATKGCAPNLSEPYVLIFTNGRFSEIRWSCPSYVPRLFEPF